MNSAPTMSTVPANNIDSERPSDFSDMRSRVIEILSQTANGCLTELGYYPGMPQKLLELERTNTQWQQENVKLFQDNRSLTRALHAQSEHLKLITGPEMQRLDAMRALEHKVQALVDERSNLLKQNEALMVSQPHNTEYGRLYAEFTKLSATYGAALNEIKQLRNYIQVITTGQYALPAPTTRPTANTHTHQPAPSPQNAESAKLAQNQMVPIRRPSAGYARPMSQQANHSQEASGIPVLSNPARPFIHYQRPISAPSSIPPNQHPNNHHHHHPPLFIQTGPSYHQAPHLPPTPMSAVHPSQVSPSQGISGPPVTFLPTSPTTIQSNGSVPFSARASQHWPQDQTRPHVTSERAHSVPSRIPTPAETPVESLPETREAPMSSSVAVTTTPQINALSQSYNTTTVPSPRPETSKRGSFDMSDIQETENQQHKKRRLDTPDSTAKQAAGQDLSSDVNDTGVGGIDIDQESDDGIIEIGPDGLRSEEDCLSSLIDDDEDDETLQMCVLCKARYDMNYTTDPPQVFIRATKEELIEHCSTEHHDAWESLRRNV